MNHNLKILYMKYNYFPTIHILRNKNLYINPLMSPNKCIFTLILKEKSLSSLYPQGRAEGDYYKLQIEHWQVIFLYLTE